MDCGFHFKFRAPLFPSEGAKVEFIIAHLAGRADEWAIAEWARNLPLCHSVDLFSAHLRQIFGPSPRDPNAAQALVSLCQGQRGVAEYATEFRTVSAECGWNTPALVAAFREGLSDAVKGQLKGQDCPVDLEGFIDLAVESDSGLWEKWRHQGRFGTTRAVRGGFRSKATGRTPRRPSPCWAEESSRPSPSSPATAARSLSEGRCRSDVCSRPARSGPAAAGSPSPDVEFGPVRALPASAVGPSPDVE